MEYASGRPALWTVSDRQWDKQAVTPVSHYCLPLFGRGSKAAMFALHDNMSVQLQWMLTQKIGGHLDGLTC